MPPNSQLKCPASHHRDTQPSTIPLKMRIVLQVLASLLATSVLVSAIPAPAEPEKTPALDTTKSTDDTLKAQVCCGLYICDGLNFTGNCYWACYPPFVEIFPDNY